MIGEPLRLRVDERRLLRELPQFFSNFSDCLTELIQNAYRAGATKVEITLDRSRRQLVVADNGRGAASPHPMLTAGATGWDEKEVIDPAGLGLFSLLGLSESVLIVSRAEPGQTWRIVLTSEVFEGAPISFEPADAGEIGSATGTTLMARLSDRANLGEPISGTKTKEFAFRQFYPVHVTYNEIVCGHCQTWELPAPNFDGPAIETPVGRFVRKEKDERLFDSYWRHTSMLWEHRHLSQSRIAGDLIDALNKIPDGQIVAQMLQQGYYVWLVDPVCGLRPKLPDRKDVVDDQHYRSAIMTLARHLMDRANVPDLRRQVEAMDLPQVLSSSHQLCWADLKTSLLQCDPLFIANRNTVLLIASYVNISYKHTVHPNWYSNGDDTHFDWQSHSVQVRNPMRVSDSEIADILCRDGQPAVRDAKAPETTLLLRSVQKVALSDGCWFGTARAAEVIQNGKVLATLQDVILLEDSSAILVEGEDSDEEVGPLFLAVMDHTKSVLSRLDTLENAELEGFILGKLYDDSEMDEYVLDWEDSELDSLKMANAVKSTLVAHYFPESLAEQLRYETVAGLDARLIRLQAEMGFLLRDVSVAASKYPEVADLAKAQAALEPAFKVEIALTRWEPGKIQYTCTDEEEPCRDTSW